MIVLDANVLIAHFQRDDVLHEAAGRALEATGDEPLCASAITLAEFLVGPVRDGRLQTARRDLDRLGVTELGLPADAAVRLAVIRTETRLRLPDCCVLLAAQDAGATRVLTLDGRLRGAARERGL